MCRYNLKDSDVFEDLPIAAKSAQVRPFAKSAQVRMLAKAAQVRCSEFNDDTSAISVQSLR